MATVGVSDQLYATAFSSRDPKEATQLLQQRFRDAASLIDELGEYLLKRAELDQTHTQALNQLAEDTYFSYNGVPSGFRPILEALTSELTTQSQYYSTRSKVSEQCKKALCDAPETGSWAQLQLNEDKLHDTARDLNLLEASMAREQRNLSSESEQIRNLALQRVGQLQRDLYRAAEAWRNDAGPIFGLAQKADRERLTVLKDCVVRFHSGTRTLAHDLGQAAEDALNQVSAFHDDEELYRFARTPSKDQPSTAPHSSPAPTNAPASRPNPLTSVFASNGITQSYSHAPGKPLPPSEALAVANRLHAARASTHPQPLSISTTPFPHSAGRQHSASDVKTSNRISSDDASSKGALRTMFTRRQHRKRSTDNADVAHRAASTEDRNVPSSSTLCPQHHSTTKRSKSLLSGKRATKLLTAPPFFRHLNSAASTEHLPSSSLTHEDTTTSAQSAQLAQLPISPTPRLTSPSHPDLSSSQQHTPLPQSSCPPIAGTSSLSRPGSARRRTSLSPLSILHNHTVESLPSSQNRISPGQKQKQDEATAEIGALAMTYGSDSEEEQALEPTSPSKSTFRTTAANGLPGTPILKLGSPNVGFAPSSPVPTGSTHSTHSSHHSPPLPTPLGIRRPGMVHKGSPSSVRRSPPHLAGSPSPKLEQVPTLPPASPRGQQLDESALLQSLHTTVKEVINVQFVGQNIARHMVVGEIDVQVDPGLVSAPAETVRIRLDRAQQCERLVPNTVFLRPTTEEHEYLLDLYALLEAGGEAALLKYQLHVEPKTQQSCTPIMVHAQWRTEPQQTWLLLQYRSSEQMQIQQVTVEAQVLHSKSLQSLPNPTSWVPSTGLAQWTVAGAQPGTIRARWHTSAPPNLPSVKVNWSALTTVSDVGLCLVQADGSHPPFPYTTRYTQAGTYVADPA